MGRRGAAAVAAVGFVAVSVVGIPTAAAECEAPGPHRPTEPQSWAQQRLRFKDAWSISRGAGVTVAVIDSGVDPHHRQLDDNLLDVVDVDGSGAEVCVGHGTMVAGIIAAEDQGARGIPFSGVAPDAKILPVKQTNTDSEDPNGVAKLAEGIEQATDAGAGVINISITVDGRNARLESAVRYALQHNVVIVAAAGNEQDQDNRAGPKYPAHYPGVIGVAAVNQNSEVTDFSVSATNVSVAAPGEKIFSTSLGGSYKVDDGTSFAAPFVAGVAALVRSHYPGLSNTQVKRRIEATADPISDPNAGHGLVNPYQAVAAILPGESGGGPGGEVAQVQPIPPVEKAPPADTHTRNLALAIAGASAGAAALILVGAVVIPRGRRRGWRPGRSALPAD